MNKSSGKEISLAEKYEPRSLSEVIGMPDLIRRLRYFVDNKNDPNFPNLFIYGNPGLGKSSTIRAFENDKFGNQSDSFIDLGKAMRVGTRTPIEILRTICESRIPDDFPYRIIWIDEPDLFKEIIISSLKKYAEKSGKNRFIICSNDEKLVKRNPTLDGALKDRFERYHYILTEQDFRDIAARIVSGEMIFVTEDRFNQIASTSQSIRDVISELDKVRTMRVA
jgi:DNA polymerase III delta prime subunit